MYYVICWKEKDEENRAVIYGSMTVVKTFKQGLLDTNNVTNIEHYSLKDAYNHGIGFPGDEDYDPKTDTFNAGEDDDHAVILGSVTELTMGETNDKVTIEYSAVGEKDTTNQVIPLKETDHDYQRCLVGNAYSNEPNDRYESWLDFKLNWLGFRDADDVTTYDDTYHFLFRYDIHNNDEEGFQLELCFMLQRKGIYSHMYIDSITEKDMPEITQWLKGRKDYLLALWKEV